VWTIEVVPIRAYTEVAVLLFPRCGFRHLPVAVGLHPEEAPKHRSLVGRFGLESALELLDGIEEEMMARSFLFTDPISYRDGVGATTEAVRAMVTRLRLVAQSVPVGTEGAS
jgi:hypothetical protein